MKEDALKNRRRVMPLLPVLALLLGVLLSIGTVR